MVITNLCPMMEVFSLKQECLVLVQISFQIFRIQLFVSLHVFMKVRSESVFLRWIAQLCSYSVFTLYQI